MPAERSFRVAGIAGSLRRASFNRGLLRAAVESAPEGMTIEPLEIRDLPHYDADLDVDGGPDVVRAFEAHSIAADGLLIATPEYNYSMSGVLKNALDWASRAPERAMQHKPVAIIGATPGRWGTVRSQMALRQMLVFPGCRVLPSPLFQVAGARERFDADGNLTDAGAREQLVGVLEAFATWIRQVVMTKSQAAERNFLFSFLTSSSSRYIVTNRYLSRRHKGDSLDEQVTQGPHVRHPAHDRARPRRAGRPRRLLGFGRPGGPGGRRGRRYLRHHEHGFPGFLGRGPRAGRGDVRAAILALLGEQPMHGYQIMRELGERSGGVWRPSPGSVYPTLQQLEDEELVSP